MAALGIVFQNLDLHQPIGCFTVCTKKVWLVENGFKADKQYSSMSGMSGCLAAKFR